MVKLDKIYTKSGDKGKTSLSNGKRVFKDDARIQAVGAVDEVNSSLGMAVFCANQNSFSSIAKHLTNIQNDLFDLGADLSRPITKGEDTSQLLRVQPEQVDRLESELDSYNESLKPLTSFVLPGGSQLACHLHMSRATTRRAERELVHLNSLEELNPSAVQYINRLSDYLFVLCRYVNDKGSQDVLWVPGQNRS